MYTLTDLRFPLDHTGLDSALGDGLSIELEQDAVVLHRHGGAAGGVACPWPDFAKGLTAGQVAKQERVLVHAAIHNDVQGGPEVALAEQRRARRHANGGPSHRTLNQLYRLPCSDLR